MFTLRHDHQVIAMQVDAFVRAFDLSIEFAHEITDVLRVPRHALDQASGAISTG